MSYIYKLNDFEGPLDLLLQLIARSKMKIEEVSIADITKQYLNVIDSIDSIDIDQASDFLVMASTLLHIKSAKMLPSMQVKSTETEEVSESELRQQLIEYDKLKKTALALDELSRLPSPMYRNSTDLALSQNDKPKFDLVESEKLSMIMKKLALKLPKPAKEIKVHTLKKDPISLKMRIAQIKILISRFKKLYFYELLERQFEYSAIVLTFMAILEMASKGNVELHQKEAFKDLIIIRRRLHE